MAKSLFIAEKPSVAQEFAKALKDNFRRGDGFLESEQHIVTWCSGIGAAYCHLVRGAPGDDELSGKI